MAENDNRHRRSFQYTGCRIRRVSSEACRCGHPRCAFEFVRHTPRLLTGELLEKRVRLRSGLTRKATDTPYDSGPWGANPGTLSRLQNPSPDVGPDTTRAGKLRSRLKSR